MKQTWQLDDGEQSAQMYADTFFVPPAVARNNLRAGDFVQLMFTDNLGFTERMWVIVNGRTRNGYRGLVNNTPLSPLLPALNTEIEFEPRHVINLTSSRN